MIESKRVIDCNLSTSAAARDLSSQRAPSRAAPAVSASRRRSASAPNGLTAAASVSMRRKTSSSARDCSTQQGQRELQKIQRYSDTAYQLSCFFCSSGRSVYLVLRFRSGCLQLRYFRFQPVAHNKTGDSISANKVILVQKADCYK